MLKGCIYGLLFWLPTYLTEKDLESQKGYISAMVDTGSFIGGLAIGYLGDKYKYRAIFLSPLLFLSSVVMFASAYFLTNAAVEYYIAMFLVGITIGGPYNIIGTVITIDLGKQTKSMGGSTTKISALV
jgi:OPA family glycerol-3-phosphate transporter-like MFS transporter 3